MYYPSIVTRYPYVSKDSYHKVTYGTPSQLSCKYATLSKLIQSNNGDSVLAVAWTMFPAGTTINYDDKIVFPDNSFPPIIKIQRIHDHVGREVCVTVYYGEGSI